MLACLVSIATDQANRIRPDNFTTEREQSEEQTLDETLSSGTTYLSSSVYTYYYKGGRVSRQMGHCSRYFIQPSRQAL